MNKCPNEDCHYDVSPQQTTFLCYHSDNDCFPPVKLRMLPWFPAGVYIPLVADNVSTVRNFLCTEGMHSRADPGQRKKEFVSRNN